MQSHLVKHLALNTSVLLLTVFYITFAKIWQYVCRYYIS